VSNAALGLVLLVVYVLLVCALVSFAVTAWMVPRVVAQILPPRPHRRPGARHYPTAAQLERPTLWGPEYDEPTRRTWRDPDQTQRIGGEPT